MHTNKNVKYRKIIFMVYIVHEKQKEIKFLKEYYPMIRDGVKTQTMRLASKRLDASVGDRITAMLPVYLIH